MREQLKWYDEKADNSPWLNALAELRQRAAREGHCFQHVQAITMAIDQYAEKALGNRNFFLNSLTELTEFPSRVWTGFNRRLVNDLPRVGLHHHIREGSVVHVVGDLLGHFFGNLLGLLLGRDFHSLRVFKCLAVYDFKVKFTH